MTYHPLPSTYDQDDYMGIESLGMTDDFWDGFISASNGDKFSTLESDGPQYASNASMLLKTPENDPVLATTYVESKVLTQDDFNSFSGFEELQSFNEQMLNIDTQNPFEQSSQSSNFSSFQEFDFDLTEQLVTGIDTHTAMAHPFAQPLAQPRASSTPFPSPPATTGSRGNVLQIPNQRTERSDSVGFPITPDSRNNSYVGFHTTINKTIKSKQGYPIINYPPVGSFQYRIINDSYIEVPTNRNLQALTLSRKWIIRGKEYIEELRRATPISKPPIDYSYEPQSGEKQFYSPEIVRYHVKSNGSQDNESRQGLCPYCVQPNFISLKSSSYTQHLSFVHGINTTGTFPAPRNYKTVLHGTHYDHSCECPVCHETLTLKRSTSKDVQQLKKYFRHFREEHLWSHDKVSSTNRTIAQKNQTAAYPLPEVDIYYRQVPIEKTVASTEVLFDIV
ncbi:hypothetical protein CLIB1444_01S18360 [[Candida] jaroonii]|uniref:Uncharacterized protein n=1 Tax=[Candida] jaroonii TaxID=467808 RepID=A0ACA9Y3L8_9ASCO|nr:hypothetical protein CLIB1444_01S18360 [[Candida] jaroonii]